MRTRSAELMAGWVVAVFLAGSVGAAVVAAVTGTDQGQAFQFWKSLWWAWVPIGLLIGFLIRRNSN